MKRSAAPLALVLASACAASAQEFAGVDDIRDQLYRLRSRARQQAFLPQEPPVRAMGGAARFAVPLPEPAPEPTPAPSPAPTPAPVPVPRAGTPNVAAYPVRGIDISHYQGEIDWSKVKTAGLAFVYIKATEGVRDVDSRFAANWKGAARAGLARGAYHFYNFCKSGSAQAAHFLKTVPADAGALPATIDLEESGDCGAMPAKAAFRRSLAVFVAKVRAASGRAPILYLDYRIYNRYFKGESDSYKLWITDTRHEAPAMPDNASWTLWQYRWNGRVAGIPREVDLDVFNGTSRVFAGLKKPVGGYNSRMASVPRRPSHARHSRFSQD